MQLTWGDVDQASNMIVCLSAGAAKHRKRREVSADSILHDDTGMLARFGVRIISMNG